MEDTAWEVVEKEFCPICPWGENPDPIVPRLMNYVAMQAAGCPIGRHELTDTEWLMMGFIRVEQEKIAAEEAKRRAGQR